MRVQNQTAINIGYFKFLAFLLASVFIGVLIYFTYMRTSEVEINRIVEQTAEYNRVHVRQIELTNRIDELYHYISLLNTGRNDAHLMNAISRRKQEIISMMSDINNRDVRLHQQLMSQMAVFLDVKDDIRLVTIEEDLVRADLLQCIEENRQATRRINIGGRR
jgi:hypothetical protein